MDNIIPENYIHASHLASTLQNNTRSKTKKNTTDPPKKSFFKLFSDQAEVETNTDELRLPDEIKNSSGDTIVEFLLDEVHSHGDKLKTVQTRESILAYRNAVRSLMSFVVDKAYAVSQQTTGGRDPRKKKIMTQIKIIDEKLDRLVADTLYTQSKQLELLSKIEEIYGMLVDLMT